MNGSFLPGNALEEAMRILELRLATIGIKSRRHPSKRRGPISIVTSGGTNLGFIKVYGGDGEFFTLSQKDLREPNTLLAYVWDVYAESRVFVMTGQEALEVLGSGPQNTASWRERGRYNWSSATGIPARRKQKMELFYMERWEWLRAEVEKRLSAPLLLGASPA